MVMPVPDAVSDGWMSALKGGAYKPCTRITVQKMNVKLISYDASVMGSTTLPGTGTFASMPFGQASVPLELKNLKSIQWSRNLDQFVSEGTITLANVNGLPVGVLPDNDGEFDSPGHFTYNRGDSQEAVDRWGHTKSRWNGMIAPDRIIRIYQGYGSDPEISPEEDTDHMVLTFTGLIDTVTLNTDKSLSIKFRDLGRALLDQIVWPDVVPWAQYPLAFETMHLTDGTPVDNKSTSGKWIRPKYQTDSNVPYIGRGFTDGGRAYVQSNGGVNGHLGRHAFDSSKSSYWLSVGNYPRWSSAFEYVQGTFKASKVSAVKVNTYGGPYTVYVSLKNSAGDWVGHSKIPYRARAVDTGADINFVKRATVKKGGTVTIKLPKVYSDIKAVRITCTDLWDSNIGEFQYRAGLQDIQVFSSSTVITTTVPKITVGNVKDYTGCVEWLLAWGGFFWPRSSSGFSFITQSDGSKVNIIGSPQNSRHLPHGRIWGDIEDTGTSPVIPLPISQFDKLPIADAIQSIKDIIGFNFFIDESGGAIWRHPNIYKKGNYLSGALGGPNTGRTEDILVIDELETLQGLAAVVSSNNVRERVFISTTTGQYGAAAQGYNPYPSGLRRYGGWTDGHFESAEECKTMADLIAVRQFMTYRESTVQIPANPAIQIDDQIKIMERITGDTYYHYVKGIESNHDISTGKWTYTLTVQWLGEDPDGRWVVDKDKLDEITRQYLNNLGAF